MFVKICGITNEQDALLAVALGADALGFVFADSKRQISSDIARDIINRVPKEIMTIGVFKNQPIEVVDRIITKTGLQGAQLHGDESIEATQWLSERVPFVVKAFSAGSPMVGFANHFRANAILIDGKSPGSGQVFDWTLVEGVPPVQKLILAGGLNCTNVAEAIRSVRPWGLDVSTGVETSPGRKDPRKLRRFIEIVRSFEQQDEKLTTGDLYDWEEEPW